MKKTSKGHDRLTANLLETAKGLQKSGLLSDEAHAKITMLLLGKEAAAKLAPPALSATSIRALRQRNNVSQAVLARSVGVTPGYISQLERGEKQPKGALLVLLNVIDRKGLGVLEAA